MFYNPVVSSHLNRLIKHDYHQGVIQTSKNNEIGTCPSLDDVKMYNNVHFLCINQ